MIFVNLFKKNLVIKSWKEARSDTDCDQSSNICSKTSYWSKKNSSAYWSTKNMSQWWPFIHENLEWNSGNSARTKSKQHLKTSFMIEKWSSFISNLFSYYSATDDTFSKAKRKPDEKYSKKGEYFWIKFIWICCLFNDYKWFNIERDEEGNPSSKKIDHRNRIVIEETIVWRFLEKIQV